MASVSLSRGAKEFAKRRLRGLFEVGQRLGVDILPRHFYSSIPNLAELKREEWWRQARSMVGVRGAGLDEQLAFVAECCPDALRQQLPAAQVHARAGEENGEIGYGPIEADFLYCFIATKRPKRVVQVGAGVSTAIILRAAKDAGYDVEVVCVDPFPTRFLQEAHNAGRIRLVSERAQTVPAETLTDLGEGGMLFIDSTHTVKPGSEVNRLILEILPRLAPGSFVHFHDISFPYDYPADLLTGQLFFWNESPLLHAFLINNSSYVLRASLAMLHYLRPEGLKTYMPNYRPQRHDRGLKSEGNADGGGHLPSSAFLEVVPAGAS